MTTVPHSTADLHTADRPIYRSTVASVAERAKAAMDAGLHGRIDKATQIVLAGDVELLPDGKAQVASQSNGTTQYFVVNGSCSCKDFPKAPHNYCKHRLASAIARRVQQALVLAEERLAHEDMAPGCWESVDENGTPCCASSDVCPGHDAPAIQQPVPLAAPVAPLPEAPASVNVRIHTQGRAVQWTLRDTGEARLAARLTALLERFPLDAPAPTPPATPPATPATPAGWCRTHGVPITQQSNAKGTWFSHQVNGSWCKGK